MYDFIKLQFRMKKITSEQVQQYADMGWITASQATEIIGSE